VTTATGHRAVDLFVFILLIAWLFGTSERLRVYYQANPARVSVVAVAPDGERAAVATPEALAGVLGGPRVAEREIGAFVGSDAARDLTPPGARLEWTIHYSRNSPHMDRSRVFDPSRSEP